MNRYITIDLNRKVIGIRQGVSITTGEIQSDIGELGQIMQEEGAFIDDATIIPHPHNPTNIEIAQMISDLQADLVVAGVI